MEGVFTEVEGPCPGRSEATITASTQDQGSPASAFVMRNTVPATVHHHRKMEREKNGVEYRFFSSREKNGVEYRFFSSYKTVV
jgi:hypothetical protein